ncbi:CAP domain-containing protein [Actibacterium pelagium]|uniref:SCP domain-containing protein n=1 Tax=Actibacterium pelagium TaxID=2029103 RepID=A0A917EJG2_9RHOB|nr:CAP domain-containing protein [Actibacterium pelagium]GGE52851.1 hypothetical protein GCM10011517_20780 [Actibacterium pelagium]
MVSAGKEIRLIPTAKSLLAIVFGLLLSGAAQACEIPKGKAQAEAELIRFTNAQRKDRPKVTASPALSAAAQKHACYMARTRKMSHTGAGRSDVGERATQEGYVWRSVAENVAKGYKTPVSVGTGWMGSRGHRRNMLLPRLTEIGIGWAKANGVDYWVMVLGAPR